MYSEKHYIMWLNSLIQIGLKQRIKLLEVFGTAEAVWYANSREICHAIEMSHSSIYNLILTQKDDAYIEMLLDSMDKAGARFISCNDKDFPEELKIFDECPLGLYIIGQIPSLEHGIAMVGSRNCTEYGASAAYNISRKLAGHGAVIVSGMADGIDSWSHKGALAGGGKTIAVMGTGIDLCYPASNLSLKEQIIENGCVLSEYPPGTRGTVFTFPQRNRIISGLSLSTIVVEAAIRSGSLITANFALEQGKDVYAVPGNITSKMSMGCNELIKNGANLLTSADDIIKCYNLKKPKKKKPERAVNNSPSPGEQSVYKHISSVPQSIEELAAKTGLEVRVLQSTLAMLEINGHITKLSGQRYIRS